MLFNKEESLNTMAVCWRVSVCNYVKKNNLKIIDMTFHFSDKHKDLY